MAELKRRSPGADNESDIEDPSADEDADQEAPTRYAISSYGADYPVDGLVKRLKAGDIVIPPFQRDYVWTWPQASRFIESLLRGLPVPGIFLSKEPGTEKLVIIDGQQRLRTLQFFYKGMMRDKTFALKGVQEEFDGKTHDALKPEDRRRLDDSIIHATVIRQDRPSEDQSSIYHIFERLNTGGTDLNAQEIRACVSQGAFIDTLAELNKTKAWRKLYGKKSPRRKDQELVLRFLALYYFADKYQRPMRDFLNRYTTRNRNLRLQGKDELTQAFVRTVELLAEDVGPSAFRPVRSLNAAAFDAVMVGTARRLASGPVANPSVLPELLKKLFDSEDFKENYMNATTDPDHVAKRIEIATEVLGRVE